MGLYHGKAAGSIAALAKGIRCAVPASILCLSAFARPAAAQISFDQVSPLYSTGSGTTLTGSVTVGTGYGRVLVVFVQDDTTDDTTAVRYNGVNMTKIGTSLRSFLPNGDWVTAWCLVAPDEGTYDVVVYSSGNSFKKFVAISYFGARQTSQPDAVSTTTVSSQGYIQPTVTTVADQDWLVMVSKDNNETGPYTAASGTTMRFGASGGSLQVADSGAAVGAGSNSLRINYSSYRAGGAIIVALAPMVPTPTPTITPTPTVTPTPTPDYQRTEVFYPASGDGSISNGGYKGDTWAIARGGTSTYYGVDYTSATWKSYSDVGAGIYYSGNSTWVIARDFMAFDTSSIGTGVIITDAYVRFVPDAKSSTGSGGDYHSVILTESTVESTTALTRSDTHSCDDTALSDTQTYVGMSVGTPFDLTLNEAGLAAINRSGYTKFCLRHEADQKNIEPSGWTGQDWVNIRSSEYSGTSLDPYLSVTYIIPTPTPTATPDIVAPGAPVVTRFIYDSTGRITEICGTAEANATVRVYDGGTLLGSTTADGSGDWCYTPATPLAAGQHSISATAEDGSGNESASSSLNTIQYQNSVNAYKDASVTHSGAASLRLEGTGSHDFKIAANGGAAVTVKAWMRKNSSYSGTAPTVTLTGQGIDGTGSATASMAGGADAWEELTVTGTPDAAGVVTLRVETFAPSADAKAWVDDIGVAQ